MRTFIRILTLATVMLAGLAAAPLQSSAQHVAVSFQVFYDDLGPYGHWIQHPTFGYVWLPIVEPDFVPYATRGHWVWTVYGWAWVSEYPWGWAPFHYGRWDYDDDYGWFWVPDVEWGPAWVVWSRCPGYYGWAPMRPGIAISIVIGGGWYPPHHWWTFCHDKYFGRRRIRNHYVPRSENGRIIGESRVIDRTIGNSGPNGRSTFMTGPDKDVVKQTTGRDIRQVDVQDNDKPGEAISGSRWSLYRPSVERSTTAQPSPRPTRVESTKDFTPSARSTPTEQKVRPTPTPIPDRNTEERARPSLPPPSSTPRPQPVKPSQQPRSTPRPSAPTQTAPKQAPRPAEQPRQAQPPRSVPQQQAPKQTPKQDAPKQEAPQRQIEGSSQDDSK